MIRESAAEAVRACLQLIYQRDSPQRPQWYAKTFEEVQKGTRNAFCTPVSWCADLCRAIDSIHCQRSGLGLLRPPYTSPFSRFQAHHDRSHPWLTAVCSRAVELHGNRTHRPTATMATHRLSRRSVVRRVCLHSGDLPFQFMQPRYDGICDTVIKYKDHRDPLVRRTVMALIPLLATFDRASFTKTFLDPSMVYLLSQLKKDKERSAGMVPAAVWGPPVGPRIGPLAEFFKKSTLVRGRYSRKCTVPPQRSWPSANWPLQWGTKSRRRWTPSSPASKNRWRRARTWPVGMRNVHLLAKR